MLKQYQVSIIIVNYNSEHHLYNAIKSIYSCINEILFEVVIIDNNSENKIKSEDFIQFANLRIINLDKNCGFSTAVNRGISLSYSEYILLLNPDTILLQNCCKDFYDFMEKPTSQDVWCCGGLLLNERYEIQKSFVEFPTVMNVFFIQFGISKIIKKIRGIKNIQINIEGDCEKDVPIVVGADMFIRRDHLKKIGYFNESFFLNYEEAEISHRANELGFRSVLLFYVKLIHLGNQSFSSKQYYLQCLADGELNYFKSSKSKFIFFVVKVLHLFGATLRMMFLNDRQQLIRIKKNPSLLNYYGNSTNHHIQLCSIY